MSRFVLSFSSAISEGAPFPASLIMRICETEATSKRDRSIIVMFPANSFVKAGREGELALWGAVKSNKVDSRRRLTSAEGRVMDSCDGCADWEKSGHIFSAFCRFLSDGLPVGYRGPWVHAASPCLRFPRAREKCVDPKGQPETYRASFAFCVRSVS